MTSEDYFFEDLEIGSKHVSPARTVTEADVVNFAGLSGDYNALHVDAEYAKGTIFGERIAHGLLGLVIGSGLFTRTALNGKLRKSAVALLGINHYRFLLPIKFGDTIHVETEIKEKRETRHPDRGVVIFCRRVKNQRGEVVQEGEIAMMIRRRRANEW